MDFGADQMNELIKQAQQAVCAEFIRDGLASGATPDQIKTQLIAFMNTDHFAESCKIFIASLV